MTIATLNGSIDAPLGTATSLASAQILLGEGLRAIVAERMKQVDRHGRTIEQDLQTNANADLPAAAAAYLTTAVDQLTGEPIDIAAPNYMYWPWHPDFWRPDDARANLVKAAALIWAAIDRLDHAPIAIDPAQALGVGQ